METLTVTCIKPIRGGFLQIYGHKKPDLLDQLDSEIAAYQPSIKKLAAQNELYPNLEFDTIYLAHQISTGKYHRCTVREKRSGNKAIIELIDYGNEYEIDASLVSIFHHCYLLCWWHLIHGMAGLKLKPLAVP